ncbi:type II secretion system protein [Campylobacter hyointestinalis]|uniref:type II secretion system protein n=1 Tax=Campylobacter hyointestinalis TaxID=198 RepID=UPI000CE3AAA3|nr:type II secretion system protein [Campylobacter hyointestinalis]MDL2346061.1 type II secretion system protein [Campylobacter hyointestinalis]MDL2349543.1 type II secretion system protein [Campylobacter hyointestinalis]MDM1025782.1 type II secretion system protein [Campylobacter hyointestinalis]MDM1028439.1 type II secretion system protein [Campylobacter hyointestinalis]PPB71920.1 transformation system protein [Campylobacter hyointestinalis subsp. hyointestinalis]
MKKAFTMIELVFVIVILGILASLAVPKLAATKTDADAAKIVVEMKNIFDKIAASYVSNPELSAELAKTSGTTDNFVAIMSVIVGDPTLKDIKALQKINDQYPWLNQCFIMTYENEALKIQKSQDTSNLCTTLHAHPTVKEWMTNGIKLGGNRLFNETNNDKK